MEGQRMRKALVIGGNGFIGSHLVDALVEREWAVTVFDLQDRRYDSTSKGINFIQGNLINSTSRIGTIIEKAEADVVFHLAWSSIHETSLLDPTADLVTNLTPSISIIEACKRSGGKIVFLSSGGAIYGPTDRRTISETHPLNPISPYGIGKLAVEKYLEMYHYLHGLNYAVVRPSTPFGPRQDYLKRQGAVAVFLYRISQGLPVTIWGDGSNIRDFFYISDLIDAILRCADHELQNKRVFNVGGSKGVTLNRLVAQVESAVGKKAIIDFQPARQFDPPQVILDTKLIRKELGWVPQTSFSEGLQKTWKWMQKTLPA
jgi:UDP-glucose 4-epimerase